MRNDLGGDDARAIWQGQPTERFVMSEADIRRMARELRSKTRRQLWGTLAGPLAAGFFCAFSLKSFPGLRGLLEPLFGIALAWSLAGLYFLNRRMWSPALAEDAGASTGLEFCRQELERRRRVLGRVLFWSFGPMLLAIGIFILALARIGTAGHGLIPNALPFLGLVVLWIGGYFVARVREQRQLQRELAELGEIERQNRG